MIYTICTQKIESMIAMNLFRIVEFSALGVNSSDLNSLMLINFREIAPLIGQACLDLVSVKKFKILPVVPFQNHTVFQFAGLSHFFLSKHVL